MEDYKWLIYLVIIASFLYRTFMKKKNQENTEEHSSEESSEMQSVLDEMLGTASAPKREMKITEEYEPVVEDQPVAEMPKAEVMKPKPRVAAVDKRRFEGSISARRKLDKLHDEFPKHSQTEDDLENDIEFDAEKAVIFSEIIRRRY